MAIKRGVVSTVKDNFVIWPVQGEETFQVMPECANSVKDIGGKHKKPFTIDLKILMKIFFHYPPRATHLHVSPI